MSERQSLYQGRYKKSKVSSSPATIATIGEFNVVDASSTGRFGVSPYQAWARRPLPDIPEGSTAIVGEGDYQWGATPTAAGYGMRRMPYNPRAVTEEPPSPGLDVPSVRRWLPPKTPEGAMVGTAPDTGVPLKPTAVSVVPMGEDTPMADAVGSDQVDPISPPRPFITDLKSFVPYLATSPEMAYRRLTRRRPRTSGVKRARRSRTPSRRVAPKRRRMMRSRVRRTVRPRVTEHIEGMLNPFATKMSVIPDGMAGASLPINYRNVSRFTIPTGKVGHLLLMPGLETGIIFATSDPPDVTGVWPPFLSETPSTVLQYEGDDSYIGQQPGIEPGGGVGNPSATGGKIGSPMKLAFGGDVARWRCVAQGMQLALINNSVNSDGYFEACRYKYRLENDDFLMNFPAGNQTLTVGATGPPIVDWSLSAITGKAARLLPAPNIFNALTREGNGNLAENEGYKLGPLRNIGSTMWRLLPYSNNHDFISMPEHFNFTDDPLQMESTDLSASVSSPTSQAFKMFFADGFDQPSDFISKHIDLNWDMVYIRIWPTTLTAAEIISSGSTDLLVHHAAKHEVVYTTGSLLHKHMRRAAPDPAGIEMVHKMFDGMH